MKTLYMYLGREGPHKNCLQMRPEYKQFSGMIHSVNFDEPDCNTVGLAIVLWSHFSNREATCCLLQSYYPGQTGCSWSTPSQTDIPSTGLRPAGYTLQNRAPGHPDQEERLPLYPPAHHQWMSPLPWTLPWPSWVTRRTWFTSDKCQRRKVRLNNCYHIVT